MISKWEEAPLRTHKVGADALIAIKKNLAKLSTGEQTQEDRDSAIVKHGMLIANYTRQGFIRSAPRNNGGQCAVNHCRKAEALTGSLKGSDTWYCAEHARLS